MRKRTAAALIAGAVLGPLAIFLWAHLDGRVIRMPLARGAPTATRLDFAPRGAQETALLAPAAAGAVPRNVVLLIADGMGFSHVAAARAALAGVNGRLFFERFPFAGWLTTHSAGGVYTDSAAAATALATGVKTAPGLLAAAPDGTAVPTLAEAGRGRGMAIGLITDSYLWDATPAAFVTHGERTDRRSVAAQMAASGATVLIGGTVPGLGDGRDDGDAAVALREHGFTVVRDAASLAAGLAAGDTVAGLFPPETIADPDREPSLAALTAQVLPRLAAGGGGFLLLVETEETDSGSHRGDFARVVGGLAALDRAARVAVDFARRDGQTLVVVTADHETGGLTLLLGTAGEPLRVRWATGNHSAEPVPLYAWGPGAERLAGARDNTEVPRILARLLDLDLAPPDDHLVADGVE